MKKAYFSPVASLLMSLSLALGILVGDVGGFRLLTSAHAQQNPCGTGGNATLISARARIGDGLVLSGIIVRNVTVNGVVLDQAVVAGSVHLSNATLVGTTGIMQANGVYVGGDSGDVVGTNGVYVGGDGGEVSLGGATVSSNGAAIGGTLTGDNITISNGVITGANLMLSGTAIDGGSIGGAITSVSITPAN